MRVSLRGSRQDNGIYENLATPDSTRLGRVRRSRQDATPILQRPGLQLLEASDRGPRAMEGMRAVEEQQHGFWGGQNKTRNRNQSWACTSVQVIPVIQ